jgi:hypothetical protein
MTTFNQAVAQPAGEGERTSQRSKSTVVVSTPAAGMLWFGGWMFAIGIAQLTFWKAVLALVVWPYFLGVLAR